MSCVNVVPAWPALMLILCTAALTGCFSSQSGPPPVELSEQSQELEVTTERVGNIGVNLTDDIARFRARMADLLAADTLPQLLSQPYPVHLFKHTAIACLNEPVEAEPEPGTPAFVAAQEAEVNCVVMPLPILLEKVRRELPGRYQATVVALQTVDALRTLRAEIGSTLRDVPRLVAQTRNFIAARRAELRRVELDVERNRPEFSGGNYGLSKRRIKEYIKALDELETELRTVERTQSAWATALGNAIRDLYDGIAQY